MEYNRAGVLHDCIVLALPCPGSTDSDPDSKTLHKAKDNALFNYERTGLKDSRFASQPYQS